MGGFLKRWNAVTTNSSFWAEVWKHKGEVGDTVAGISGRSDYRDAEREGLLADALGGLELRSDDELLEVGCAAGYMGREVAHLVKRYVGLDLSMGALRTYGRTGLVQGLAQRLPFKAGAFTKSYMSAVLLCMTKREAYEALVELFRVTRKRAFVAESLSGQAPPCRNPGNPRCLCFAHVTWFNGSMEFVNIAGMAGWRNVTLSDVSQSMRSYGLGFNAVLSK